MRRITKKLHSEHGASLMVALLMFLLCLTIGSLIVTTALSGALKAKNRYSQQQAYLAVSSAARLLKDTQGRYTYTTGEIFETWETGGTDIWGKPETASAWVRITPFLTPSDAAGGDLLTDAWTRVTVDGGEYHTSFTIDAHNDIPVVEAQLTMLDDGDTNITLTCDNYAATVTFTARTAMVTDETTYRYFTTSWSHAIILKGGA